MTCADCDRLVRKSCPWEGRCSNPAATACGTIVKTRAAACEHIVPKEEK